MNADGDCQETKDGEKVFFVIDGRGWSAEGQ